MQRILILLFVSAATLLLANGESENRFQVIFTDNTAATGGPNDIGQTGDLELIYNDPDDHYKVSIKAELFVNGDPDKPTTERTDPNNIRTDLLSVYFIQGNSFKYGMGFEILGDLGGGPVQNLIHDMTHNPHIPAKYIGRRKATPTLNFEYRTTLIGSNLRFVSKGKLPFLPEYGVTEFDAMAFYDKKNLYTLNIDAGMGLGFDCRLYPNTIAFKGYPLNLYQVCTPETKFFLSYKDFHLFWEIPLMNMHVQNSILGISYAF